MKKLDIRKYFKDKKIKEEKEKEDKLRLWRIDPFNV